MKPYLLTLFKHPALFVGSIIGAFLCAGLGIYYAMPGVYHISLGHSHPPLDPKLDYMAGFLVLAVLARRVARARYPEKSVSPTPTM